MRRRLPIFVQPVSYPEMVQAIPWHKRPPHLRESLASVPGSYAIDFDRQSFLGTKSLEETWALATPSNEMYIILETRSFEPEHYVLWFRYVGREGVAVQVDEEFSAKYPRESPLEWTLELVRKDRQETLGKATVNPVKVFVKGNRIHVRDTVWIPDEASPFGEPVLDLELGHSAITQLRTVQPGRLLIDENIEEMEVEGAIGPLGVPIEVQVVDYGLGGVKNPYERPLIVYGRY